ncbi:copper resistance protein [Salmonella enterica subsp. enterica serovar Heidelberg]|nr:copper resistance protein [Salmonella enterica subsp. enterica serovar Heidelberg]ECX6127627.1 copper resistance protein [Salmonella enterica subsp. enterica serovar Heidelberg]
MSIKNDGHYFCRAGGNRPDGLNEPVTDFDCLCNPFSDFNFIR